MIGTIGYAAGLVLLLASAAAQAQAAQPDLKLRMDTGFYLGATVGRSEARDFCTLGGACDSKDTAPAFFSALASTATSRSKRRTSISARRAAAGS